MVRVVALSCALLTAAPVYAWNAVGHKVIAEIAWQQFDESTRKQIVATLREHPRFTEDFAPRAPRGDDEGRWIFQHAAVWPETLVELPPDVRAKFEHPTWRHVRFPLVVGDVAPAAEALGMTHPSAAPFNEWNAVEATKYCLSILTSDKTRPESKALAYSWIIHLVGELHQPLHTTVVYAPRLPAGDSGAAVAVAEGGSLYAVWENSLGEADDAGDVQRTAAELRQWPMLWVASRGGDAEAWARESHALARTVAYCPEVVDALGGASEAAAIALPADYAATVREHAQRQIVAAGLRLATLLEANPPGSRGRAAGTPGLAVAGESRAVDR
jgi:hypothetical protein